MRQCLTVLPLAVPFESLIMTAPGAAQIVVRLPAELSFGEATRMLTFSLDGLTSAGTFFVAPVAIP